MPKQNNNDFKEQLGLSPVRIYVLWHPDYDVSKEPSSRSNEPSKPIPPERGLRIARRIYHWFRMENMEGIPVYFRSAPSPGSQVPLPIFDDPGVRNYVVALVDANMVACPDWRAYMTDIAMSEDAGESNRKNAEYRLLPVALEPVAYNMPERIRRLNFIRNVSKEETPNDDFELISKLTEVICRDLRHRNLNKVSATSGKNTSNIIPDKIRIFLSHAKADDTDEAVAIKEYIQKETQCEAFFDETDIASGYDFTEVLEDAVSNESAGLIVLQGDNYADRPWCRKEIRDFLKPQLESSSSTTDYDQYAIAPVIVVQTMKGQQMARTIPELGYSPCIRWLPDQPGAARFIVTTLLREICCGLFYRALAQRVAQREQTGAEHPIYLNRSPDPVMVNRIIAHRAEQQQANTQSTNLTFVHPGYGLSKLEHEGLTNAFPGHCFRSFLGVSSQEDTVMPDLRGKIIALSAGNPGDLISRGLWEEHMQELLIRLLQPILQAQSSLLYGGAMPATLRPLAPWEKSLNFTGALLQLLLSERDSAGLRGTESEIPRLYVPTPCHRRSTITPHLIALWSDVCSFVHVPPEDAGFGSGELEIQAPTAPTSEQLKYLDNQSKSDLEESYRQQLKDYHTTQTVIAARGYSSMRRKICDTAAPLVCELPDASEKDLRTKNVATLAHILIGGKLTGYTGIMAGIFEEALCAFENKKPVFLIAEYGGAAALLASWLLNPPEERPPELTAEYYSALPSDPQKTSYSRMIEEFEQLPDKTPNLLTPTNAFDRLWSHIQSVKNKNSLTTLLQNGLNEDDNRALLTTTSTRNICQKIWNGIIGIHQTSGAKKTSKETA